MNDRGVGWGGPGRCGRVVAFGVALAWQPVRLVLLTLLVLIEPLLRVTLVPLAFGGFLVTLCFGFVVGDPRFPRWGMLGFSVGMLWLYWLFLGLTRLVARLP